MNAEHLLTHFDRIANAPDAISRLRRFILDLAVRGKLVEQDPNDEPAAELLKRIAAEKKRLVKAGAIKKRRIALLNEDELPFALPANWKWSQIAEIGLLSPRNEAADDTQASFVPMPMIAAAYGVASDHEVRRWGDIKKGYTHFAEGDVGLAKITPCFQNGKSTVFRNLTGRLGSGTTELHIVRPLFVNPDFILLFLKCSYFIETGIPRMTGTAGQKRVPTEYFAYSPFPLPPLTEQHRIVAKVDELMALCDRLETSQKERETTRNRLTEASLARLNAPDPDLAVFQNHATFALNNLVPITTRPDQIKALRQTILNLAVRGKLVEQAPNDEPAEALLQRAKAAKTHVMAERKIGSNIKPELSVSAGEDVSPEHWVWTHLNDFALVLGGKRLPAGATFSAHATKNIYIRVSDMRGQSISTDDLKYISDEVRAQIAKYTIERTDLYITIAGTIGNVGEVPEPFHGQNLTENAAKIVFREIDKRFLLLVLQSANIQGQFQEKIKQMAQPKLALKRIAGIRVPLPPLTEQHRIIAKVDELMAMCDRLEASLATDDETRGRLVEAMLREALESATSRETA